MLLFLISCVAFVFMICDVFYFLRTYATVLFYRLFQRQCKITESSIYYGIGTFQDCDTSLVKIRDDRIIRELDFARYHFYDRTGIYSRSTQLDIKSLQGCTYAVNYQPIPLFLPYKIVTQLVYWDDKSLFLEHEVYTIHDKKLRSFLISRQHAIGEYAEPAKELLKGLQGSDIVKKCPEHLNLWFKSMKISSDKLRSSVIE